jgi:hypothetical protein
MDKKIISGTKPYRRVPGCFRLYKFFVWIGNKFYVLSEKCVWYSRDRERKIEADEAWEKKVAVGDMVLENERLSEEYLEAEEIRITCKETVEELGATYMDLKRNLDFSNYLIWRLWEAFCEDDRVAMEKIFREIGLEEERR